jgi:hypothetical protein
LAVGVAVLLVAGAVGVLSATCEVVLAGGGHPRQCDGAERHEVRDLD